MTDREKVQTIRMWINEAIHQGNRTVLVMAIKSILDLENDIEFQSGVVKLSEKSMEILKAKNAELKETFIKMNNVITETFSNLTKAKELMQKLIVNAPDTYSGTNIELQQKKMFSFQDAVNNAEQFLKDSEVEKMTEDDFLERIDNGFNQEN